MLKLTQPHLSINNMFPPISSQQTRPASEDLNGVGTTSGAAEIQSPSKQNQIRRQQQQQTTDQQRRTPLRSNSLIPSTTSRYVSSTAAVATAAVQSPSVSISPLVRSPSFVQTGTSAQYEPAKIIYRTSDYAWNDHPNTATQVLRASSPTKNKSSTSVRNLTNGTLNENPGITAASSVLHIPPSLSTPQQHSREDMNNGDCLLASTAKSRQNSRLQRTNSHLDKTPGTAAYGLPMRSESYRSSRLDYGLRPRHNSSKQRNYVTSKTSFHDLNAGEFYLGGAQDENIYYHQQQHQQMTLLSSTQRINGSTLDLTASRKPLSPNKSSSFNVLANGTGQYAYYTSTQELQRNDINLDRNNLTRFPMRAVTSKEQVVSIPKYRHTSGIQTSTTPASTSNTPGERHPSAQSYKSRDPNLSYAYNDVKKYIEENDLMSPEKEQIIRNWILDVEKYRNQLQKIE